MSCDKKSLPRKMLKKVRNSVKRHMNIGCEQTFKKSLEQDIIIKTAHFKSLPGSHFRITYQEKKLKLSKNLVSINIQLTL
jgi:hypothetical protein